MTRTTDNALLPKGKVATIRTPVENPVPLYPPCGTMQIGSGTPTCDGYIDPGEWAGATVFDVSDTCGQSDGLPNPPGTVYLYLMKDSEQVYFGIDAVADLYQDYYDQAGLYTDDIDDGCWEAATTIEGNLWCVDDQAGGICIWRWWQDYNCAGNCVQCMDYMGAYTGYGGFGYVYPACFGTGTSSGNMQMEVGFPYGAAATDDWMIQTNFDAGETCGFYMYYLDQYYYDFMGEIPCTGASDTYIWPCSWPSLLGVKPEFTFKLDVFQTQVPIGGTLDFAVHYHNNTCASMTIYDTIYAYRGGNLLKKFTQEWSLACEQDLDVCFALKVPPKDNFICWDVEIVKSGEAHAGGASFKFEGRFTIHIEPGHKSEVPCP
jgi:hypothetical protein